MCLFLVKRTKPWYSFPDETIRAWKIFMLRPESTDGSNKLCLTGYWRDNLVQTGCWIEAVRKGNSAWLIGYDGRHYPFGFHAFRSEYAAEFALRSSGNLSYGLVLPVQFRLVQAEGQQIYGGVFTDVVVAKEMHVPENWKELAGEDKIQEAQNGWKAHPRGIF